MFDRIMASASAQAAHTARSTAIGLGAGILLCIGIGFWTLAGWMFLLTQTTAVNAAMIIGALYTGAALLGFGFLASRHAVPPPTAQPAPPTFDTLVAAFMTGLSAGSRRHP
jgi:hypothetical protein